jgi:hypothetical protein
VVMLYVRYPLSLRNVEDLAFERGIDICHETVRGEGDAPAHPVALRPRRDALPLAGRRPRGRSAGKLRDQTAGQGRCSQVHEES